MSTIEAQGPWWSGSNGVNAGRNGENETREAED
jgi:hypothetical protein